MSAPTVKVVRKLSDVVGQEETDTKHKKKPKRVIDIGHAPSAQKEIASTLELKEQIDNANHDIGEVLNHHEKYHTYGKRTEGLLAKMNLVRKLVTDDPIAVHSMYVRDKTCITMNALDSHLNLDHFQRISETQRRIAGSKSTSDIPFDILAPYTWNLHEWIYVLSHHKGLKQSGYGNVRTQTTDFLPTTRIGKEWSDEYFNVKPDFCKDIASYWSKSLFLPSRVKAVPYKMNVYEPGSHFDWHKDTPSSTMVGTALFCIFISDDCDSTVEAKIKKRSSDKKSIKTTEEEEEEDHCRRHEISWHASKSRVFLFYTDVPHQVTKCTKGLRVTLSFKIYSVDDDGERKTTCGVDDDGSKTNRGVDNDDDERKNDSETKTSESANVTDVVDMSIRPISTSLSPKIEEVKDKKSDGTVIRTYSAGIKAEDQLLIDLLRYARDFNRMTTIGFLLSHDYSWSPESKFCFKGQDAIFHRMIMSIIKPSQTPKSEDDPIIKDIWCGMVKHRRQMEESEKGGKKKYTTTVTFIGGDNENCPEWVSNVPFILLDENDGYKWHHDYDPGAEYTGNESRPSSLDSTYIHVAIVVNFQTDDDADHTEDGSDDDND